MIISALGIIGLSFADWAVGRACGAAASKAHKALLARLGEGKAEPNYNIERAVLRAHYQALQFVIAQGVEGKELDPYEPGVGNARDQLRERLGEIEKAESEDLASKLSDNWQSVIRGSFTIPDSAQTAAKAAASLPADYAEAALEELLAITGWDEKEKPIVAALVKNAESGWAAAFCGYAHQGLKQDTVFREIYSKYSLETIMRQNEQILAKMAPAPGLQKQMNRVEQALNRIETKVDEGFATTHEKLDQLPDIIEQAVNNAVKKAQKGGISEAAVRKIVARLKGDDGLEGKALLEWLDQWIIHAQAALARGHNEDAAFERALDKAKAFFAQGEVDRASGALMDELAADEKEETHRQEERARRRESLWREAIGFDRLAFNIKAAQQKYNQWTAEKGLTESGLGAWFFAEATALGEDGERSGDYAALLMAVSLYRQALRLYTKAAAPMDWAMTQNNLGVVYQTLGARGEDGALQKAIDAYKQALTVYTKAAAPMDWAMTQNNLGAVYSELGERGEDGAQKQNLEKAIKAYQAALSVRTKAAAPMDWAMTQNNLGAVYSELGERGEDGAQKQNLEKAIKACQAALSVRTKAAAPMQWAMTQNNLGVVYKTLGERGEAGAQKQNLEKAIDAYKQALTVYTKAAAPMDWAMSTQNLGYALWALGEKQQAEADFRGALDVFREKKASYYINKLEINMRKSGLEP